MGTERDQALHAALVAAFEEVDDNDLSNPVRLADVALDTLKEFDDQEGEYFPTIDDVAGGPRG